MKALRSCAFAAVFAVTCLGSSLGLAAPNASSPQEKAEAQKLAAKGREALRKKRWSDALGLLRKAARLDPNPTLEVDLAAALAGSGKLVEASKTLARVVDGPDTPATKRGRALAQKALAKLKPRIPAVQVTVRGPDPDTTAVLVDGIEVDTSNKTEGVIEVPVNPGDHTILASAEGFEGEGKEVSLVEGAHAEVVLRLKRKAAPAAADAPPPPATTTGSRVPGAVLTSIGGAGLVVGAVFGGLAISAANGAKAQCQGVLCPPSAAGQLSQSKLDGNVATGMLIGGGIVAATGIVLLIVAPGGGAKKADEGAPTSASARFAPWLGPGSGGLGATGSF